ncbi:hypothetical protein OsJ_35995 [Oryza sativa Japonica Group]|uniref:Uncharacterized protein n=1 Tax=Oryza sativa subsp. japonica TaxID=39947 RepID=B9GD06_ORYSJ|nr:hypothetical protein OsJ_35995 [Oryza sativa Japonica Group]
MAADEPLPNHMASPKNSSMESELQVVLAGYPENSHGGVIAGRPPESLDGGGGAVVVRAQTVRVKVNRLVVLVPSALRARSRAAKMVDAAALPAKRGSYWRIAGRGRGGDKSELFYQRPIPLGRRCRVQHLEEVSMDFIPNGASSISFKNPMRRPWQAPPAPTENPPVSSRSGQHRQVRAEPEVEIINNG